MFIKHHVLHVNDLTLMYFLPLIFLISGPSVTWLHLWLKSCFYRCIRETFQNICITASLTESETAV